MTQITGIGRSLQFDLVSHRIVLAGSALGAAMYAAFAAVTGRPIADALVAGVVIFVAWAIGRELDPDRPNVAAWSMPLAFGALLYDVPSAVASAVVLIGVRLVAGTIGASVTWVDVGALAVLGYLSASNSILWIVAVSLVMWVFASPEVGRLRYVALAALVVGIAAGYATSELPDVAISQDAYLLAAIAGGVMMLAMKPIDVVSHTDTMTEFVNPARIGLARKTAGSFIIWAGIMGGVAGFWMVSPALAALVATAFGKWFSPGA